MAGNKMKKETYLSGRISITIAIIMMTAGLCLNIVSCTPGESPFVAIGDSVTEGVQSADANLQTQPNCFPYLIARQIGFILPLPWILSNPLGVVGDAQFRSRLFPDQPTANFAVSGADISDVLLDTASDNGDREIDLVLPPYLGMSQIEIVEISTAPFVIAWVGNNDVLGAVTAFDELNETHIRDAMTSAINFEDDFQELAGRLSAAGKMAIYGNIPDVTKIGFLVDGEDLRRILGDDFGLKEGNFTTIVVIFLLRLGLVGAEILLDPNFILDETEIGIIQERTEIFNDIIDETVSDTSIVVDGSAVVIDIYKLFDDYAAEPPIFAGITLKPNYLEGLFSLDGVHPSNIGQALIANAFIEANNDNFMFKVDPLIEEELNQITLEDPFVDVDGDGVVRGRPGAGLLETLAPFLGVSGDNEKFIFAMSEVPQDGQRVVKEYLKLKGYDSGLVDRWGKSDSIDMFRDIFGLK
jgi:hypothetical protein